LKWKVQLPYGLRIDRMVRSRRWPDLVAEGLGDTAVENVLQAVENAGKPVAIAEVPSLVPRLKPEEARAALDLLVTRAALVEDLDAQSLDVMVGLLPTVREARQGASQPYVRPPLMVCERPREFGPVGPTYVDDLRAVLLEIATEPPRLKKDGEIYARELARFEAALEPFPEWLEKTIGLPLSLRLDRALERARRLKYVRVTTRGGESLCEIDASGNRWLASGLEEQIAQVFELYQRFPSDKYLDDYYHILDGVVVPAPDSPLTDWVDVYSTYLLGKTDTRFLGTFVTVKYGKPSSAAHAYHDPKRAELEAVRDCLAKAFQSLRIGTYHDWESLVRHFGTGPDNVLLRGQPLTRVQIAYAGLVIPDVAEIEDAAAGLALRGMMMSRLIPLGCLTTARDEQGRFLVARTPLLSAYFGTEPLKAQKSTGVASAETKVVVQPDFTVTVIGMDPSPVAEIVPFTDRISGRGAATAKTLKITRESVVRAVARGLSPKEIVDRLERLASHEPPSNVLKEIQEWGSTVRKIQAEMLSVLRCPDKPTADRVAGILKKARRINDTLIEVDPKQITSVERDRLRAQGVLVEGRFPKDLGAEPKKAKRRGSRW
ncbi:MAG: helicase-associated domain-containing protein, partial [Isosphaeraceae bacterium]